MTTPFDPNTFLNMSVDKANDTVMTPVPPGEYTAVVKDVTARQWQGRKDPSKSGIVLDVTWFIDDSAVKELLGREEVTVRQGIMLDLNNEGGLDMEKGKNVSLGRLREAVNLNEPGQTFSFNMLQGQAAKVVVSHRIDGDTIYAEVKQAARLS